MLDKKKTINLLPEALKDTYLFRNAFIKNGNRERAFRFMSDVHGIVKTSYRKGRLKIKLKVKVRKKRVKKSKKILKIREIVRPKPHTIINEALHKLKPGFILRRLKRAGKTYKIPVPISDHRASYLASKWFRQAILDDTKSAIPIPHLIFRELRDVLRNRGKAVKLWRSYITTAIDQRPFTKFLRKVGDTRPKKKKKKKGKSKEYLQNPYKFYRPIYEARLSLRRRLNRRLRRRLSRKTKKNKKRLLFIRHTIKIRSVRQNKSFFKVTRYLKKLEKERKKQKRYLKPRAMAGINREIKKVRWFIKAHKTKLKNHGKKIGQKNRKRYNKKI